MNTLHCSIFKHASLVTFYCKGRLNNVNWNCTVVEQCMTKQGVIQGM